MKKGHHMTPEQRQKISVALAGKKRRRRSEESIVRQGATRRRLSATRQVLHVRLLALLQLLDDRVPMDHPVLRPLTEEVSQLLMRSKLR